MLHVRCKHKSGTWLHCYYVNLILKVEYNYIEAYNQKIISIGQGNNDQIESSNHHEQLSHNPIEKFESPEIEPSIVMNMNQYGQNGNEAFMDLHVSIVLRL